MKKQRLIFTVFLCVLFVLTSSMGIAVSAAPESLVCNVQTESDGMITVSGNAKPESYVMITVYEDEKKSSDLSESDNHKEIIPYADMAKADDDGIYEFEFYVDGNSRKLNILINTTDSETATKIDYIYCNNEETKNVISQLNGIIDSVKESGFIGDAEKTESKRLIAQVIENNRYALHLWEDVYKISEIEDICIEEIYNLLSEVKLDTEMYEESVKQIQRIYIFNSLNYSKLDNIFDYAEVMEIDVGNMREWYNIKLVTDEMKYKVTKRISACSINDMNQFNKAFEESLVLEIIAEPDGYDVVEQLLKQFEKNIGINTSGVSDSVYKLVSGKNYENYEALKDEFEKYVDSYSDNKETSSGGSKRGNSSASVSVPVNKVSEELIPIPSTDIALSAKNGFTDVTDHHWAKTYIDDLYERGIINGRTDKTFCPEDAVLREEFVRMIISAFNIESEVISEMFFDDVKSTDWFYDDIQKAYSAGIINGMSSTEFGSGMIICREDMAVIVMNVIKRSGKTLIRSEENIEFKDEGLISEYALESVKELQSASVLSGDENGYFNPEGSATRAQAAKVIYKLMSYFR